MRVDKNDEQIRVILFRDGDQWVAQCLEYDIGAQAGSLPELHERLLVTLEIEKAISIEKLGKPFAGIPEAPAEFFKRWEQQSGRYDPKHIKGAPMLPVDYALCA